MPAPAFLKLELDDLFSLLVEYFYITKPEISWSWPERMLCHSEHSPRLVAGRPRHPGRCCCPGTTVVPSRSTSVPSIPLSLVSRPSCMLVRVATWQQLSEPRVCFSNSSFIFFLISLYSKVNQSYIIPSLLDFLLIEVTTDHWVEFPALYSKFSILISYLFNT